MRELHGDVEKAVRGEGGGAAVEGVAEGGMTDLEAADEFAERGVEAGGAGVGETQAGELLPPIADQRGL